MTVNEFRRLTQGRADSSWCEYFGVGAATFRRWKTGKARIPGAVERLLRIRCNELSALAGASGKDWEDFSFGPDGKFYHPFWSRGFDAGQLKAMFFQVQDAWADKRDLERLRAELVELRKSEAFYRRQCQVESRMGLMLSRIAG